MTASARHPSAQRLPARSPEELADAVAKGDARSIGRAISLIERNAPTAGRLIASLPRREPGAHVIGLTGPPGVGKSTTTSALVSAFRDRSMRVAVLAIDPSSPINGGALLGDRIRMREHALDQEVFIRSMASRGHLGGLAVAAPQALQVLSAAGFDVILLETVGVGQSEVEVSRLADTTVLLTAPGMGDGIQAAKAGVMEVGDIFAINKADRDGAGRTMSELRRALALSRHAVTGVSHEWVPPVVMTVAAEGRVQDLVECIDRHWTWLIESGALTARRERRSVSELEALTLTLLKTALRQLPEPEGLEARAGQVRRGEMDVDSAAAELCRSVARRWRLQSGESREPTDTSTG